MSEDMLTIGIKIGKCFDTLQEVVDSISADELSDFGQYLEHMDTVMPVTDPTLYMRRGMNDVTQARQRLAILRRLKKEVIGD